MNEFEASFLRTQNSLKRIHSCSRSIEYSAVPQIKIMSNSKSNHLANERSLYLQQHASNPIDWHPWNEEALALARQQDKPIFLSIGYSSCHWCHVMEHEVFEKHDVATFMNDHFVSIKVDREERPDLDATYMQAVQMMTGGGGWPMSVFLTPDLRPFFGGTYYPHDAFVELTKRILEVYKNRRNDVDQQASSIAAALGNSLDNAPRGAFHEGLLDGAVREAQANYDRQWGGMRGRMKFPTPVRWLYLLRRFRKTGDPNIAEMVRGTLDHMAAGGLRDHLAGGFHRYTVDSLWLVPHFEKMLYDNAQLASLYLEAGITFNHTPYLDVSRETLDFLMRDMRDTNGGLYASFDADSDGEEGSFYVWTVEQIMQVAGPKDGRWLAALLGATDQGNFEGSNVLWRHTPMKEVAQTLSVGVDELRRCWDRWRPELLRCRNRRIPPTLDKKVVTAWNGLAIASFAQAAAALNDNTYLAAAEKSADFLWRVHRKKDGSLYRSSNHGEAANDGILDDYGAFALALLDLHKATGNLAYFKKASALLNLVVGLFSRQAGGFFLTSSSSHTPLGRRFDPFDNVEPSGNTMVLDALQRLAALTGKIEHHNQVRSALEALTAIMPRAGLELAGTLDVGQRHIGPTYEVVVAGDPQSKHTRSLCRVVRRTSSPYASLLCVPTSGPDDNTAALLPPTAGKSSVKGQAVAYVCSFGTCQAPTSDPQELHKRLKVGWKK